MGKIFSALFLAAGLLVSCASASSAAPREGEKAAERFRKDYPGTRFDEVRKTPVEGLYEIIGNGYVLYYFPKSSHVMFGALFSKDGKNLTETRLAEQNKARIAKLPLEKAIRLGSGKNVIIEISDPDCPFCRKAHEFLETRRDATRYVFLMPIAQLHPKAEEKSRHILCSGDKAKAYEEAMAGRLDSVEITACADDAAGKLLDEHKGIASSVGVVGTPVYFINGVRVDGADTLRIRQLLDASAPGKKSEGKE
jgi:thiol:disulfide interchange protein DsbC